MKGSVAPRPMVKSKEDASNAAMDRCCDEIIFLPDMLVVIFFCDD
jgi:hypothetical protein